jgi:plasmid stabilization system protein ParE
MVKFKIEWSVEARLDLLEILEYYINRNKSTIFSIKLNSKINKSIKFISKNPYLGIQTDFNLVRTLISGEYQIIYEIVDQVILIIMVWDMKRNPEEKVLIRRIRS